MLGSGMDQVHLWSFSCVSNENDSYWSVPMVEELLIFAFHSIFNHMVNASSLPPVHEVKVSGWKSLTMGWQFLHMCTPNYFFVTSELPLNGDLITFLRESSKIFKNHQNLWFLCDMTKSSTGTDISKFQFSNSVWAGVETKKCTFDVMSHVSPCVFIYLLNWYRKFKLRM